MSEMFVSILISCAILAALAIWVPTLHLCHGCLQRLLSPRTSALAEEQSAADSSIAEAV